MADKGPRILPVCCEQCCVLYPLRPRGFASAGHPRAARLSIWAMALALMLMAGACATDDDQPEAAAAGISDSEEVPEDSGSVAAWEDLSEVLIPDRANAAYSGEDLRPETTAAPRANPPAPPQ